ncbi:MAG: hypothetical protein EAZ67_04310 [Cytophagales bacterium]|nr:MAG: hypothetical protein EAZ67_04310 [Cytophagales bacterium]
MNQSLYMVEFTLPPQPFSQEFLNQIPAQRMVINRLMADKQVLSYMLALEDGRMWAVLNVESEPLVIALLAKLPLNKYMEYNILPLTFYNAATTFTSHFSLN